MPCTERLASISEPKPNTASSSSMPSKMFDSLATSRTMASLACQPLPCPKKMVLPTVLLKLRCTANPTAALSASSATTMAGARMGSCQAGPNT
ncbi:hypothetical protein D3C80_1693320 [compost metagenome]